MTYKCDGFVDAVISLIMIGFEPGYLRHHFDNWLKYAKKEEGNKGDGFFHYIDKDSTKKVAYILFDDNTFFITEYNP